MRMLTQLAFYMGRQCLLSFEPVWIELIVQLLPYYTTKWGHQVNGGYLYGVYDDQSYCAHKPKIRASTLSLSASYIGYQWTYTTRKCNHIST